MFACDGTKAADRYDLADRDKAGAPHECCGGLNNVDYSKNKSTMPEVESVDNARAAVTIDLAPMEELTKHINFYDPTFCVAVIAIVFNPLFWNVVARWEHRTRRLSRLFGSPHLACYCLGFVIILLNVYRSHSMTVAMKSQARWEVMDRTDVFYVGTGLIVVGTLLVVSSFLALGFTGTFLGDYFGILMDNKVTAFPFNIMENPMYWGSTANYLGLALIGASPVGLVLTLIVAVVYKLAIKFEGPFTAAIYQERSQQQKRE